MGEIADDMIDGVCCAICGVYFVKKGNPEELFEHGYPVVCNDCYDKDCGYPKQDKKAKTL